MERIKSSQGKAPGERMLAVTASDPTSGAGVQVKPTMPLLEATLMLRLRPDASRYRYNVRTSRSWLFRLVTMTPNNWHSRIHRSR